MAVLTGISPGWAHAAAGNNLPSLGEAGTEELSPLAEKRLGEQIYQQILRAGVVMDDPEASDYLRAQAYRLLKSAELRGDLSPALGLKPEDFTFFMIQDPSLNAFALPGGKIGVHSGLFTQVSTEAELMSVLAHEIGHVTQRHIARSFGQQREGTAVMVAASILALLAVGSNPQAAIGLLSLGDTLALQDQLSFSRDAEREADRVGLSLMQATGFNPNGMVSLFERLGANSRLNESRDAPAWLRSHPLSSERVTDAQSRLQQLPPTANPEPDSKEFLYIRARLMAQSDKSNDQLTRRRAQMEAQLKSLSPQQTDQEASLSYGLAWLGIVQRRFEDAERLLARTEVAAARPSSDPRLKDLIVPLMAHARAHLAIAENQPARALQVIESSRSRSANSVSARALDRLEVEALLGLGRAELATSRARLLTSRQPGDPQGWRLLAQAADRAGRRAEAHEASAEQLLLQGALPAAIEQLELGRRVPGTDFLLASRLDARLQALKRQRLEELREAKGQGRR